MESAFRDAIDDDTKLIETMLWMPGRGIIRQDRHLARLARSAVLLGFPTADPAGLLSEFQAKGSWRLRLTMDRHGAFDLTSTPYKALTTDTVWSLRVSRDRLSSSDPWLTVKSTRRRLYDRTRAAITDSIDEVIFANERGELCEGTITNVFADFGQGLVTPPCSSGLLPGILREEMLEAGRVQEQVISIDKLWQASAIYVGNALRGLIRARLL